MENFVEWPHLCDVCNKAFSKHTHLIKYQHVNNGKQPYEFIYWVVKECELPVQNYLLEQRPTMMLAVGSTNMLLQY